MNEEEFQQVITSLSDDELMTMRVTVDSELTKRGISFNVGALGEKMTITYFNSTSGLPNLLQAPTGAKNVDALSRQGDRYSIKAFMKAKKTGTIYPDENNMDKQLFEYLVVVRLNQNYQLEAIYRYTWSEFEKIRAWDKRMNAWYVPLSNKNLKTAEKLFPKG
ncbi:MAG: hypothetical protein ACLP9S_02645 [Syntrophales bacterium]